MRGTQDDAGEKPVISVEELEEYLNWLRKWAVA